MAANLVFKNGFFQTDSRSFKDSGLKQSLVNFIEKEEEYKSSFLQRNYDYGFDGYSYLGQEDSSNQYASDLLHSFVISDFVKPDGFPREFEGFFELEWKPLQEKVKQLELEIIDKLDIQGLKEFYQNHIGHMISCNFYPRIENLTMSFDAKERLSEHTDVSLFTIFPFGFDGDFFFEDSNNTWVNIPPTNDIIVFPGYLLELISNGQIKALNHKVNMPKNKNVERFSFAYFSLPYPNHSFQIRHEMMTSEQYFEKYLRQF